MSEFNKSIDGWRNGLVVIGNTSRTAEACSCIAPQAKAVHKRPIVKRFNGTCRDEHSGFCMGRITIS